MDAQPTVIRLSARDLPADERETIIREAFGRGILNLDITPLTDDFRVELQTRLLPGVALTKGWITPHIARTHDSSRESDGFILTWAGACARMRQLGREVASDQGATLLTCAEQVESDANLPVQHHTLRLERPLLLSVWPRAEEALVKPLPMKSEAFRLLASYLDMLNSMMDIQDPRIARAVAIHICELVALTLSAGGDGRELATRRGLRAGRLSAVKRWTLQRLADPALSLQRAAAAANVSPRYVQMLFHDEGTSFSEYVRRERLALARRQLSSGSLAEVPISTIALNAGFSDISYFNRTFRAAYGETPSDVKRRAKAASAE